MSKKQIIESFKLLAVIARESLNYQLSAECYGFVDYIDKRLDDGAFMALENVTQAFLEWRIK